MSTAQKFASLALLACAAGCGRPETAADRHFAEMREQVARMQGDHDKIDQRLGALEVAQAEDRPVAETRAPKTAPAAAPPGRVVQLGAPTDADPADPNDSSPRPDIRVTGPAGAASLRPRSGKSSARGRQAIEDPEWGVSAAAPSDTARPSALDPEAKKAYETALANVQAKSYDRGLEGLNAFLVRWPDHPYVENALYWRGEAYFAKGEYLRAAEQFDGVVARFGSGNKSPDALLKLGMCHERLGSSQRAHEYWDRLKNEYPRSDAAKRIPGAGRDASPKGPRENR